MSSEHGTLESAIEAAKAVTGENPCRYLAKSLVDDKNARRFARSRIRGLEDINTVRVWKAVESRLSRGPRTQVIAWLDERQAELEAYDDRTCFEDWLDAAPKADPDPVESVAQWEWETETGNEVTDGTDRGPIMSGNYPSLEAFKQRRNADGATATDEVSPAVATDGGQTEGDR